MENAQKLIFPVLYKCTPKCYCEHKSKVNHKTGKFGAKVIPHLNQSLNVFKFQVANHLAIFFPRSKWETQSRHS